MPYARSRPTNHHPETLSNIYARPLDWRNLLAGTIRIDLAQFVGYITGLKVESGAATAVGNGVVLTLTEGMPQPLTPGRIFQFGQDTLFMVTERSATLATTITGNLTGTPLAANTKGVLRTTEANLLIPAGTPVSRAAKTDNLWGYGDPTHDEFYLLAFDIPNAGEEPEGVGLLHGHQLFMDKIPLWDDMAAPLQQKIAAEYIDIPVPANAWA